MQTVSFYRNLRSVRVSSPWVRGLQHLLLTSLKWERGKWKPITRRLESKRPKDAHWPYVLHSFGQWYHGCRLYHRDRKLFVIYSLYEALTPCIRSQLEQTRLPFSNLWYQEYFFGQKDPRVAFSDNHGWGTNNNQYVEYLNINDLWLKYFNKLASSWKRLKINVFLMDAMDATRTYVLSWQVTNIS